MTGVSRGPAMGRIRVRGLPLQFADHIGERAPLDELHRVVVHAALATDGVDRHDVRMVQVGGRGRFGAGSGATGGCRASKRTAESSEPRAGRRESCSAS